MRILHIGSGFRPWRTGGIVAYVEDLMAEQVRAGHDVTYFFSGRQYPFLRRPRLRRWRRDGVAMLEVVSSPLHDHGRQPELELDEPRVERLFEDVLRESRPDVAHAHELAGLPSSVLDITARAGVPTTMTLQDYFAVCPTFKLLDSRGELCVRSEIGVDCVATTAADSRSAAVLFAVTLQHDLDRLALTMRVPTALHRPVTDRIAHGVARLGAAARGRARRDPAAFQRRRDVNVARLNRAGRLVAMSPRVAELHEALGVDPARLVTMQLTLAHIERLTPRAASDRAPVTFATLGALESPAKGGRLLLDALRILGEQRLPPYRLLAFGWTDPALRKEAARLPHVELRGRYEPGRLDALLDEVDVGLMPSVWEEAYGYAGIEFLAKGIPVIGNAVGGIVEYVRPGESGWLNRSCSARELAGHMRHAIEHPAERKALNAHLLEAHDSIVKPMAQHAAEVDALYAELRRR